MRYAICEDQAARRSTLPKITLQQPPSGPHRHSCDAHFGMLSARTKMGVVPACLKARCGSLPVHPIGIFATRSYACDLRDQAARRSTPPKISLQQPPSGPHWHSCDAQRGMLSVRIKMRVAPACLKAPWGSLPVHPIGILATRSSVCDLRDQAARHSTLPKSTLEQPPSVSHSHVCDMQLGMLSARIKPRVTSFYAKATWGSLPADPIDILVTSPSS